MKASIKIRNFLFDYVGHVLILGNIAGYWLGYKTAITQYRGEKIFVAFLVVSIIIGLVLGGIFEWMQEKFKISTFNWYDVFRTAIGFVGGFATSFHYRDTQLFHVYNWTFGITALLYTAWCIYLKYIKK